MYKKRGLTAYKGISSWPKDCLQFHSCTIYLDSYTVQFGNNHPKMCMRRNACAQFVHTRLRLSVHASLTRLISMIEVAYCILIVLILLLVLADFNCKSVDLNQ